MKKGRAAMKIQEFCNMKEFEAVMKNWAEATGLACVAVGLLRRRGS